MKQLLFSTLALLALSASWGVAQNDWGIKYVQYPPGQIYADPHIEFEFRITNHGPNSYPAGTVIHTASRIVGTVFALDLLGPGPTPITLAQNLGVGESFTYDPGYLDGAQTLAYFGVDSGEFCLIVYGSASDPVDLNFPNDPHPADNMACITWTAGQVITGQSGPGHAPELAAYPNPCTGTLHLNLPAGFKGAVSLYTVQGQPVRNQALAAGAGILDLSGLPAGLYHYRITDARQVPVGDGLILYQP